MEKILVLGFWDKKTPKWTQNESFKIYSKCIMFLIFCIKLKHKGGNIVLFFRLKASKLVVG